MSKDIGLHTKDTTIRVRSRNGAERSWKRTALVDGSGERIFETSGEKDGFGLCVTDNGLKLNGEVIAPGNRYDAVKVGQAGVSFGMTPITTKQNCIRITKEDYRLLRMGKPVAGYARYRPENVYYITTDTASTNPIPFNPALVAGHEDIIWNSFIDEVPHNTPDVFPYTSPDDIPHNALSDATVKSVKTPMLDLRHYDAVIEKGDKLELEYFVDTHDYDSVYKGIIEDTFTVIVSNANGDVLLTRTTYAGQFKVSIDVGNTVGSGWFSIRCVDYEGRGSVETFGDYRIVDSAAANIKELTATEMANFGLTIGNNVGYEPAYKNHRNFAAMCHALKDGTFDGTHYDGVKLYNANPNLDLNKLSDPNNSVIEFDNRWNVGEDDEYEAAGNTYYLLYYNAEEQRVYYYDQGGNGISPSWKPLGVTGAEVLAMTEEQRASAKNNINVLSLCDESIIEAGASFVLGSDNTVTVGSSVAVGGTTRSVSDVFDWIRWDGASLYRDSLNKILVYWPNVDSAVETMSPSKGSSVRLLRVRWMNRIMTELYACTYNNSTKEWTYNLPGVFPEGSGYYYCAYHNGRWTTATAKYSIDCRGDYEQILPDNFTIDLNGCVLKNVGNIEHKGTSRLLYMPGTDNVCVKNGSLIGVYDRETIKTAFLKLCFVGGTVWEGAGGLVDISGTNGVRLENLLIDKSHGYEIYGQAAGNGTLKETPTKAYLQFGSTAATIANHLGWVDASGASKTNDVIVTADNGASLITDAHPDYNAGKTQHVCLLTSDMYSCENLTIGLYSDATDPNSTLDNKTIACNEFSIGTFMKLRYGGAYPYYFVNFYDGSTWVKTVKTDHWLNVKVPADATQFNVTVYGVCEVDGTGVHVLMRNNAVKYVSDYFNGNSSLRLKFCTGRPCKNAVISRCTIKNTRTIALGDLGVNPLVENTTFDNIGSPPERFSVTPMLADFEETCGYNDMVCFRDSKVIQPADQDGLYVHSQSVVGIGLGRRTQFIRCDGFGIDTCGQGCMFADSVFSKFVVTNNGIWDMNCRNIIRRCATHGETGIGWTMSHKKDYKTLDNVKSCYEQVPTETAIEDCLFNKLTNITSISGFKTVTLVGRRYKIFNGSASVIHDEYNE